jgi:WD40 repeat protein
MSSSRWLLLASPRSAQSAGVGRELTWWREQRGTANICIALIEGELSYFVDVVDIATGAITRLPGGAAVGVAYDGEQLLIQRLGGTFEVRSANGQQLIRSFAGDGDATADPVVNGAGLAVEVNPDGTAPVFDVASGQQIGLLTLPAGPSNVSTTVAFAGDGQHLISATEDADGDYGPGYVTVWNFSPSHWSTVACSTSGHTLTNAEWQEYVGSAGPGIPSHLAC